MKLTDVDVTTVEDYIVDEAWTLEQKMDGARALMQRYGNEVSWVNSAGTPLTFAAAKLCLPALNEEILRTIPNGVILDGELIPETGVFHVFDAPVSGKTYLWRRGYLSTLLVGERSDSLVRKNRSLFSEQGKRDLWERIVSAGVEGAVAKRVDGMYEPGKRVRHQVKLKLIHTVDAVVMGRSPSPNSMSFGAYNKGILTQIGNCSMIGKPPVEIGDVVELVCLNWTGQALYQPRMKRVRLDKNPHECTFDQLQPYSREAL